MISKTYNLWFQTIRLSFSDFSLETHSACQYDSLTIHDGDNENAGVFEKLCGPTLPQDVLSTGSNLYLEFKTDGSEESRGFSVTYNVITSAGITDLGKKLNQNCIFRHCHETENFDTFSLHLLTFLKHTSGLNCHIFHLKAPHDICEAQEITDSGTTITSPGYNGNSGSYPDLASCNWTVVAAHNQVYLYYFFVL